MVGSAGATILGRTIVSNIIKLIPGAGSIAGGLISGATAGIITTALGETYIKIMEMVYKGEMKAEDIYSGKKEKLISKIFKEQLKKERHNK